MVADVDTAAWADALQVEAALAASTGREQCGHVASVPLPIDATLLHEHQHIYQRPGVGSPCCCPSRGETGFAGFGFDSGICGPMLAQDSYLRIGEVWTKFGLVSKGHLQNSCFLFQPLASAVLPQGLPTRNTPQPNQKIGRK